MDARHNINAEGQAHKERVSLVGLLVACPYNQDNPDNCPLYFIRKRSMNERLKWLDALCDDDVRVLYSNHTHCLGNKEKSGERQSGS